MCRSRVKYGISQNIFGPGGAKLNLNVSIKYMASLRDSSLVSQKLQNNDICDNQTIELCYICSCRCSS